MKTYSIDLKITLHDTNTSAAEVVEGIMSLKGIDVITWNGKTIIEDDPTILCPDVCEEVNCAN